MELKTFLLSLTKQSIKTIQQSDLQREKRGQSGSEKKVKNKGKVAFWLRPARRFDPYKHKHRENFLPLGKKWRRGVMKCSTAEQLIQSLKQMKTTKPKASLTCENESKRQPTRIQRSDKQSQNDAENRHFEFPALAWCLCCFCCNSLHLVKLNRVGSRLWSCNIWGVLRRGSACIVIPQTEENLMLFSVKQATTMKGRWCVLSVAVVRNDWKFFLEEFYSLSSIFPWIACHLRCVIDFPFLFICPDLLVSFPYFVLLICCLLLLLGTKSKAQANWGQTKRENSWAHYYSKLSLVLSQERSDLCASGSLVNELCWSCIFASSGSCLQAVLLTLKSATHKIVLSTPSSLCSLEDDTLAENSRNHKRRQETQRRERERNLSYSLTESPWSFNCLRHE